MKVLTAQQEAILDLLLKLAGSSGVLEMAMLRARGERGEKATLEDVVRQIVAVKQELLETAETPA